MEKGGVFFHDLQVNSSAELSGHDRLIGLIWEGLYCNLS